MSIASIDQNTGRVAEFPGPEAHAQSASLRADASSLLELTDGASLSSLAPRLRVVLDEIAGPNDNVVSVLSDNVGRLQEGFIDTLYPALSANGVDLSNKLTLRLGQDDMLAVSGEHPEQEAVSEVLQERPELSAAFREIASQSEMLRDMRNISKVMSTRGGVDSYARMAGNSGDAVYQMSLKGDMSHFYFSKKS